MLESLELILFTDFITLLTCTALLVTRGGLVFGHPATSFLFYHFYANTFRLYSVLSGDPLMYADQIYATGRDPVTVAEISRAILWMDVGLILFTAACLYAKPFFEQRIGQRANSSYRMYTSINLRIVRVICVVTFVIGSFFFAVVRGQVQIDLGTLGSTGYLFILTMWPLASLLIGVYFLGFRWYLLMLIAIYLALVSVQGYHRFMLVLPLILLANIYVYRERRNWPSWPFIIIGIVVFSIFPYLKTIGRAYQAGDVRAVRELVSSGTRTLSGDVATSQQFLDQFACALTLADQNDRLYWGRNYFAFLTYPVPRVFWPDKPTITQYMQDIATPGRPVDREGRIVTWLGDAYLNFGTAGMLFYPVLLGFVLTYWACWARFYPHDSLWRFWYVMSVPALIQLWRDGVLSLAVFSLVHFMPLLMILVVHFLPGVSRRRRATPQLMHGRVRS